MTFSEAQNAIAHAKVTLAQADEMTPRLVAMVLGRLRTIKSYVGREDLKKLKRELHDFDGGRKMWREEK